MVKSIILALDEAEMERTAEAIERARILLEQRRYENNINYDVYCLSLVRLDEIEDK